MNRLTTFLLSILMLFSFSSLAQKKQAIALQWKIAGELPAANGLTSLGIAGPVAGVHNNVLIVGGGANFPYGMPWRGGAKKYYDDVFVFEKNKDSIVYTSQTFHLPFTLAYTANCSTPQGIVCAGGENAEGLSKKVMLLQWNEKAKDLAIKDLPDLPFAVTNASITYTNGLIYLAGGEIVHGVSNHFLSLDLNNIEGGWKQLPSLPRSVSHAVMVVQSNGHHNCIYLIGGRKKKENTPSDLYASVFQFDFTTNQWTEKKSLPYALSAGTGIATGNNSILLFGGDRGETFHKTELLITAINAEKDSVKKQQLIQQKAALQASHPGFSKEILLYNTIENKWMKDGCIPFHVPATTTAVMWGGDVIIPSGEIKAGVRTPQILMATLVRF
ncbi:MAG: kelch repeat-containing protein [Flavisolibacter sp.]